jgi:hypothetical protein
MHQTILPKANALSLFNTAAQYVRDYCGGSGSGSGTGSGSGSGYGSGSGSSSWVPFGSIEKCRSSNDSWSWMAATSLVSFTTYLLLDLLHLLLDLP